MFHIYIYLVYCIIYLSLYGLGYVFLEALLLEDAILTNESRAQLFLNYKKRTFIVANVTKGVVLGGWCLYYTNVFKNLWKQIGNNIHNYKTYPRIVGETGGKDFIWAHNSANPLQVATGITRGAFEFQGQKCSAASRAFIPASMWEEVKGHLIAQANEIKMGSPEDPSNYVNAVIHEGSFDKIASFLDAAKTDPDADIIIGGGHDKSVGYFIEPTVIVAKDPMYKTMCTELFGPVMTIYVYEDAAWEASLKLVDESTEYALTGAIFSTDRYIVEKASKALENAAGNFYINDKPTGAVVGQQPFGGARASGTNDKAGSAQNLLRWTSVRLIKETFVTPKDYKYPFLG